MQITCPHCQFSKDVDQQWIPRNPSQVECPECKKTFYFSREEGETLEIPQPESPSQTCPSCGLEQPPGRSCVSCGIVFSFHKDQHSEEVSPSPSGGEFSFETEEDVFDPYFAPTAEQIPKAGFWIRFVAIFIDGIIFSILLLGMSMVVMALMGHSFMELMMVTGSGQMGDSQVQAMAARMSTEISTTLLTLNGLYLLLVILYFVVPTGRTGQTLGKKVCGIRVIRSSGQRGSIGFWRALLREIIGKWLSGLLFGIGYLMAAFHKQKQALHDLVAGTYVTKAR
ncbi:MAG TPA: RDD family protein [Desulfuromonadales bacterium]|nr:RDD family protein [Desulfuromonadales bacterium]